MDDNCKNQRSNKVICKSHSPEELFAEMSLKLFGILLTSAPSV